MNLDTIEEPRITYISSLLPSDFKKGIIAILQEFKDCFAWNYDKMLGLDRSLVEHRLPINLEFHSFQQLPEECPRRYRAESDDQVKRKLLICSSLLIMAKWFAVAKEKARYNKEQNELKTSLGFAASKLYFVTAKEGRNIDTTAFRGEVLGKWFLS